MERERDQSVGMIVVLAIGIPLGLHLALFPSLRRLLLQKGITRINYADKQVPTAGGIAIVVSYVVTLCSVAFYAHWCGLLVVVPASIVVMCGGAILMGLWGWLDDVSADKAAKGFRGHLAVLIREGRMTSGLWKVVGGGTTALLASIPFSKDLVELVGHTLLLSLSANLLNLFDLRPTRALKMSWLLLAFCFFSSWSLSESAMWLIPILTGTLLFFFPDSRQRIMLGDTGANALGFIAGMLLMQSQPFALQLAITLVMMILHILAEFISFSQVIQSVGWLRRVDQLGRR